MSSIPIVGILCAFCYRTITKISGDDNDLIHRKPPTHKNRTHKLVIREKQSTNANKT